MVLTSVAKAGFDLSLCKSRMGGPEIDSGSRNDAAEKLPAQAWTANDDGSRGACEAGEQRQGLDHPAAGRRLKGTLG
jgi:hypothetical protein